MTDPHREPADFDAADPWHAGAYGIERVTVACPNCGLALTVGQTPADGLLACPDCGAEFLTAAAPSDERWAAAHRLEYEHRRVEQELNDLRIRQIVAERRAAFRTRSYVVVGLCGSAVIAVELGWRAVAGFNRSGIDPRPATYLAGAIACLVVGLVCLQKVRGMNAELARPVLDEPAVPPDFSSLSDGSQRVAEAAANLERLSGRG